MAIEFLQKFRPNGPWTLHSIKPEGGAPTTATFTDVEAMRDWIHARNGKENLYFSVNPTKTEMAKKSTKADVSVMAALHVDCDPRSGEDFERERQRILRALQASVFKPTVIIDSGGGYQAFWKLRQPVAVTVDNLEELEGYNRELEIQLGGDHCHNIDRIMRLSGTLNIPSEKKRKRGRVISLAKVVEMDWDRVHDLADFKSTPASTPQKQNESTHGKVIAIVGMGNVSDAVSHHIREVIVTGGDIPAKYPSRSEAVYAVSCELARAGCEVPFIAGVLLNPEHGISESILEKSNPHKYALRQAQRGIDEVTSPELRELNDRFAVVMNEGGKCVVFDVAYMEAEGKQAAPRQKFSAFKERFANRRVAVGQDKEGKPIYKKLADWWLENPLRRQFETVVFEPEGDTEGALNLWQGFAVKAAEGQLHQRFLDHILHNLCSGNKDHFEYLVQWMAHAVQRPWEPAGIAVAFIGGQGTGKSFFADQFGKLFGCHYVTIVKTDQLTGRFNAVLQNKVLVLVDEVVNKGDAEHEGRMKVLISQPEFLVEMKGLEAYPTRNCLHFVIASNNPKAVPYSQDDRRHFILEPAKHQQNNRGYFEAIERDMQDGGYRHLLHYLQQVDIGGWRHKKVPFTEAAHKQLVESMGRLEREVLSMLETGIAVGSNVQKAGAADWICLATLAEATKSHPKSLSTRLKSMGVITGERVERRAYRSPEGEVSLSRKANAGQTAFAHYMYKLNPLAEVRERFDKYMSQGWPDDGGAWQLEGDEVAPF